MDTLRKVWPNGIVMRRKPVLLVESKWSDTALDPGLRYLKTRFPSADAWQVSGVGKKDYLTPDGIRVAPVLRLLSTLR